MSGGAGSDKVVVNPGIGGVIQRRALARPNACTFPTAASESSALCTVPWLVPSAIARAELDHDSPSARNASTSPFSSSTVRPSTTISRAPRGASTNPRSVARTSTSYQSSFRSRPISTRNRMRCDSSTCFAPNALARRISLETSPGHASPRARASANNTGRVRSDTTARELRTTFRQASTMRAFEVSKVSTSSSRSGRASPFAIRRAAWVFRTFNALLSRRELPLVVRQTRPERAPRAPSSFEPVLSTPDAPTI